MIVGAAALGILLIVCVVIFWPDKPETIQEVDNQTVNVQQNQDTPTSITSIRKMLLNPSEAKEGFEKLKQLVKDDNPEALFIMSRLYAVSSGSFTLNDDFVTMQANLQGVVDPNPAEAHRLLGEIIKKTPSHYQALYELACDYYDPVFINKISALLRKY